MSNRPSSTRTKATSARVAQARHADRRSNAWWLIGGIVLAISAALILAIVVATRAEDETARSGVAAAGFNTDADAPADLVNAPVTVEGEDLPAYPESRPGQAPAPDPAVGRQVPAISGQMFNGSTLTIPSAGKPKVVLFLAHWCPHCQKEVPVLTEHLKGGLPADVDLYAVSTAVSAQRDNYPPGAWLRRENWPVPTLLDDEQGSAADAYGLGGFPFFVAVDRDGKVVERASGELTGQQFDDLVAAARNGAGVS